MKSNPDGYSHLDELDYLRNRLTELEELNRDYLGMIENSFDAMSIADCDGRLLLVNPAFERLMGIKKTEALSRTVHDLTEQGITDASAASKALETGKEETVIINTHSGRQVLSTGVPFYDHEGKIIRVYCNIRDVTELNYLRQKYNQTQKLASKYLSELLEFKKGKSIHFVAHSKKIQQVLETVYRIAVVDSTVLILGESGVGKDLVARIIHETSTRNESGTFLKINCAAIPADLLESELFGYAGGAFTGANKEGKVGYFEIADHGTIFLDEIGELPKKLQVKLLAVIQDQKFTRVGGIKEKAVDVRIIAATNRNLEEMVRRGDFREDLYYRLNVVPVTVPPLRERRDDIPFLIVHYLDLFNQKYHRETKFAQETMEILYKYHWPGNVRELANLVERLVVTSQEAVIYPDHIPDSYCGPRKSGDELRDDFKSLNDAVEEYELKLVKNTLAISKSREEAALKLGISLSGLNRRVRKLKRLDQEG